jgi:hypothetical protein
MTQPGSLRSRRRKNGGMGDDGDVRSYVLSVRLSPAERVRVMEARRAWGISASEIGRRRLLGEPLPRPRPVSAPIPQVNVDAYRELGRIGSNLTQLAYHFEPRSSDDPSANEVLGELRRLLADVRGLQRTLWMRP